MNVLHTKGGISSVKIRIKRNKQNQYMFNLDKFIADSVTFRPVSMFAPDIEANKETLTLEIKGKKVCVIGGASGH